MNNLQRIVIRSQLQIRDIGCETRKLKQRLSARFKHPIENSSLAVIQANPFVSLPRSNVKIQTLEVKRYQLTVSKAIYKENCFSIIATDAE